VEQELTQRGFQTNQIHFLPKEQRFEFLQTSFEFAKGFDIAEVVSKEFTMVVLEAN